MGPETVEEYTHLIEQFPISAPGKVIGLAHTEIGAPVHVL